MLWKPKSHTLAPKIRSIAPSSNTGTVLSGPFINEYKPQFDKNEKKMQNYEIPVFFRKKGISKDMKAINYKMKRLSRFVHSSKGSP